MKENIVRGVLARGDPTLGLSCANLSMRVSKNGSRAGSMRGMCFQLESSSLELDVVLDISVTSPTARGRCVVNCSRILC